MKKEIEKLHLPEGTFETSVLKFDKTDILTLKSIYDNWRNLCDALNSLEARAINLPEGLSESIICLHKNWYRFSGSTNSNFNSSFDCYDPNTNARIQVKASAIQEDLTSFGPKSVWDKLYFLDFYREGKWDGSYDCYFIDTTNLYSTILNKKKKESFKDQQDAGKRPRLSIMKEFIKANNLTPETFYIK